MDYPSTLLFYICCILSCTVTFGLIYISPSKSVIEQGDTFEINCTVKPLTDDVEFFLDGISKGDCIGLIPGIAAGTCSTGITQDINTDETTLTIASASIFTNHGIWKCTHNGEIAQTNIYVYNFQTVLNNNQYELPSTIDTSSSPNSEFKVFVGCGYPQPIVTWTLDKCDGSQSGIVVNTPTLTTNASAGCTSPLVAYTSEIKASDLASPTVATCYIPKATMTYTEKPAVLLPSLFTSNVQFPAKSPDSPESSKVEIIAGVIGTIGVVIIIIPVMILVYKKYSRKDQMTQGTHFALPASKTPVLKDNEVVEPSQKPPVRTGYQLEQSRPEDEPQIDYPKGMPLKPEGQLMIKTKQDYVEFQWKPPKSDGGSHITEYIVDVHGIKFGTWETFAKSSTTKLQVPMEKFKNGEVMSFRVRAENENGLSEPLLAQKPFTLQNSHDLLSDRPVATNQGRGHEGFLPRNSVGTEHKESSLLEKVPIDRTLPKPV